MHIIIASLFVCSFIGGLQFHRPPIAGDRATFSGEQEHDPRQGRHHLRRVPQAAPPLDHGLPRHGRQER